MDPNRLTLDCRRPDRLYRYSTTNLLERSLLLGEFRLTPATRYQTLPTDTARHDNELVRIQQSDGRHVHITDVATGRKIVPIGPVTYRSEVHSNYLMLCFSTIWDHRLFRQFPDTDACLIINEVNEFCDRIHTAAEDQLADWAGMDGAATYGAASPLGAVFAKPLKHFEQQEWRFAWLPIKPAKTLQSVYLKIGNIETLAEVRLKAG